MNRPCGYTSKEKEPKDCMFTFGLGNTWSTNSEVGASFRPYGVCTERNNKENME